MHTSSGYLIAHGRITVGDKLLLDRLCLHLPDAAITAIMGPAAVGKTTLLRVLAGASSHGDLRIFGLFTLRGRLRDHWPEDEIAYFPQQRDPISVASLCALSASKPSVLLLDEPLVRTDHEQRALAQLLAAQRTRGLGVIVTHDLTLARALSDHVCLLCAGKAESFQPTAQFFDAPKTALAAQYVRQGNCWPRPALPSHFHWVRPGLAGMGRQGVRAPLRRSVRRPDVSPSIVGKIARRMDGEGARVKASVELRAQEPGDELVRRLMLAHTSVFADPESTVGLAVVLDLLLQATDSTDGFIAEVAREGAADPVLVRSTGGEGTSGLYVERRTGAVDLTRLDAAVDSLLRTGCVAASPALDDDAARTSGLSYLGLPIIRAGELVGVSVVANRAAGYAMQLVDRLSPFLVTAGVLIDAARNARFRRDAERDLTRSAEMLKDAHELANLGSFHFDLVAGTAFTTKELSRILGHKGALDLRGPSDLTPYIHPDDRTRWARSVQRCLAEGSAFAGDFRIVVAHDRVRHLHVRCRARRDGQGIVREGSCTLQDVTKRVLTDRAYHASEARRARLWERVTRVQDEERRRIARELHDHAGATLAALLLRCKLIESAELPPAAKEEVATLARQLEESVAELSRLARGLHPASLDELGLGPALQQLVRAQSAIACIDASVYIDLGDAELPPAVQLAAYRIAQEALTNVVRHSGARHINARCARAGAFLVLSIIDDGRGFDPAALDGNDATHGLGLMGMRERAHFAGGKLEISSSRATGTRIEARFPITASVRTIGSGTGAR